MNRKVIILANGLKRHLPDLEIGEVGFCRDTYEYFVGTDEGNKKLFHLEYLLTDLYLVNDIERNKFKLSDEVVSKLRKEYGIK